MLSTRTIGIVFAALFVALPVLQAWEPYANIIWDGAWF